MKLYTNVWVECGGVNMLAGCLHRSVMKPPVELTKGTDADGAQTRSCAKWTGSAWHGGTSCVPPARSRRDYAESQSRRPRLETPMTTQERRFEIRMQVLGGDHSRVTYFTENNRVLLHYGTSAAHGEASHWRAVMERMSCFIAESEAGDVADVAAFEEQRRVIGDLEMKLRVCEQANAEWRTAHLTALRENDMLKDHVCPEPRRVVKKQPAKRAARKRARK